MELVECVTLITIVALFNCTCQNLCSIHCALKYNESNLHAVHAVPWKSTRYLGARIAFYDNSTATFQLKLLVARDINPNPGPMRYDGSVINQTTKQDHGNQRILYNKNFLVQLNHSGTNPHLQNRLPHDVWKNIRSGIIHKT